MTELEQIAASVAKALDMDLEGMIPLSEWIFHPAMQVRCRDWLLERGAVHFLSINALATMHRWMALDMSVPIVQIECPATQFCARAIHELMKK